MPNQVNANLEVDLNAELIQLLRTRNCMIQIGNIHHGIPVYSQCLN